MILCNFTDKKNLSDTRFHNEAFKIETSHIDSYMQRCCNRDLLLKTTWLLDKIDKSNWMIRNFSVFNSHNSDNEVFVN